MVDFVSEVQEELRKEDYNKWLRQYGPYLFAGIMILILGTAFYEWRKDRLEKQKEIYSLPYMEAASLIGDDNTRAIEAFMALSEDAPSGYAGMALVRAASLEYDSGNTEQALKNLEAAAGVFETKRHAQYAQLKAGYMLLSDKRFNDVIVRITPLTEKYEPYEFLARELVAVASYELGDADTAREHFDYLSITPGVPQNVQKRALQNLTLMAQDAPVTDIADTDTADNQETEANEDVAPVEDNVDE